MREEFQNLHRTNQEMAILLHLLEEEANKNEDKQNYKVTELRNRIEHLNQINQEKESQLHNLEEEARRRDDQHCVEMSAMVERIVNLNKKVEEWSLQLKTFEEEARIKENRQQNENAELKEKIEQLKTFQEKALQLQALEEEFRIKQNEYSLQLATLSEQIEHLNKENKEKNEQMKNFEEESHRKKDEYSCKIAELDKKIENLNKTNLENFDRIKKLEEELQKKKDEYSHKIANLVERMGNLNKENIEKSNQLNILNEQMEYLKKTNLEKEDHIRQLDGEKADLNSKLNSLKLENEKLLNEKEVLSLANAPIITTACSRFVSQPNNEYHYPNSSPPAYSGLQVEPYIQSTQGRSCLPPSERLSPNTSLSVIEENSENTHNQSQQQKSPSPKPRVFKLKGFAEQKKPPPNAQLSKRNLIKKRQLTNAANSSISSKFSKKKQMPVNVLANEKPWRPHGSKQNQLIKPSHLHNKTPTNNEKSAKRKLQLGSTIGSPMFSSTPNNGGLKFPQFVLN